MAMNRVVKEEKGIIALQIQYAEGGGGNHLLEFKICRDDALRRIFLDFCDSLGLVYATIKFMFEGKCIKESQSAQDIGLEDGDLIDAFNDQVGGAAAST